MTREKVDLTIVGGGILGTLLAYWVSLLYEAEVAVIEMERDVALHTSGRNTGVIHRPFYLDPERRKIFARSAQISFALWKKYASQKHLPWKESGTLEVAMDQPGLEVLEKYSRWALENGMDRDEISLMEPADIMKIEPNVTCLGALMARTDTSVDYGAFTRALRDDSRMNGIQFKFGFKLQKVHKEKDFLVLDPCHPGTPIETRFLLNCAGGNSLDISRMFGVGLEYTDLHFRGEYWEISKDKARLASRNIYSVPRRKDLPFLDPHWVVRSDGRREIGPNAVLVSGSGTYESFSKGPVELIGKIFERPLKNKIKLLLNKDFIKLVSEEWQSSLLKSAMADRVRKFIPSLTDDDLIRRGTAGIRSNIIDSEGRFAKEVIEIPGHLSYHILNYNSPGATGAPAYTAYLLKKIDEMGMLSGIKKRSSSLRSSWNFSEIVGKFI